MFQASLLVESLDWITMKDCRLSLFTNEAVVDE